ncbi:MAG: glycosyltransferase [Deltaproteobacteria bacterium]|nr:glycosyltransferase [Deltaproteobacteria bacterium]
MSRRVLVLTHGFLPWGGSASERVTGFCRHLRSYGWEPFILCASKDSFHQFDEPRAEELWQDWQCRRIGDHATWRAYRLAESLGVVRVLRGVLTLTTGFPDIYRWWAERCKAVAEQMCESVQPTALYSCSPPDSVHLIGMHLKRQFGIPWIMDLRDAWRGNRRARYLTTWHKRIAYEQYGQCIRMADRIIANSDGLAEMITEHLGELPKKVEVITNGYEESLFADPTPRRLLSDSMHTILYGGATFHGFVSDVFTQIRLALDQVSPDIPIRLVIVGESAGSVAKATTVGHFSIEHQSQFDVPGLLLGADVLILIMDAPGKEVGAPTVSLKTYGYLRSGRSIVYIGPDAGTWQLLSQFRGTYKYEYGAWDDIAIKLIELCRKREDWTQDRLDKIMNYSWQTLTGSLAAVFESSVQSPCIQVER